MLLVSACGGDGSTGPTIDGRPIHAVTLDNRLLLFGSEDPGTIVEEALISGLPAADRIVALDFRPADGLLYGVGTDSRLYVVDPETAEATPVGTGAFAVAVDGEHFGLDFNPTVDRLRTASVESEQNLRLNPADGSLVAEDVAYAFALGDVNEGANPAIGGLAYTNSVASAVVTVLYGIDSNNDVLVTLPNPNNGQLVTIGPLGVNTVPCIGFDIDPSDGTAFASLADAGVSSLYTVDLATGAATLVGVIAVDSEVQGMAVEP
ncbi:MAG: DUF4394 domain-containing protein [Gemmatimonadales bacterium]